MIDVRFTADRIDEVRHKYDCGRMLAPDVRLRMYPPHGRSYIALVGDVDYWGDLEVIGVGRRLLTVRDSEGERERVDPTSGRYEYHLFTPDVSR